MAEYLPNMQEVLDSNPQHHCQNPKENLSTIIAIHSIYQTSYSLSILLSLLEFIVIHNGIITNYKDLKKFLVSKVSPEDTIFETTFESGTCNII